jgi:serine/threonine protein kinase
MINTIINNKYKIIKILGSGNFGSIYQGINIRTNENIAIKVEPIANNTKLLKREANIYHYIGNCEGIPIVKWFGKDEHNYYMVINLLGKTLETFKNQIITFSLKQVLQIGIHILKILKTIHNNGYIHRDIKPDNFLFSIDRKTLYIIDFGLCKRYIKNDMNHIEMKERHSIIGTPNFASIHSHNCIELSRRDDLESLIYILYYLYLNDLPWINKYNELDEKSRNDCIKKDKEQFIYYVKMPKILYNFYKYVLNLEFEETPNYNYWIQLFQSEAIC